MTTLFHVVSVAIYLALELPYDITKAIRLHVCFPLLSRDQLICKACLFVTAGVFFRYILCSYLGAICVSIKYIYILSSFQQIFLFVMVTTYSLCNHNSEKIESNTRECRFGRWFSTPQTHSFSYVVNMKAPHPQWRVDTQSYFSRLIFIWEAVKETTFPANEPEFCLKYRTKYDIVTTINVMQKEVTDCLSRQTAHIKVYRLSYTLYRQYMPLHALRIRTLIFCFALKWGRLKKDNCGDLQYASQLNKERPVMAVTKQI